MGTISLVLPQIGQPDTTEDVKLINGFTAIQSVINGNLDSTNLNANAAVARSQMAGGLGGLVWTLASSNTSATDGHFYWVSATATVTLPAPTANVTVGVYCGAAATVTVSASSGAIGGLGLGSLGASSFTLGTIGAAAVLIGDGTNWHIVAGQQDTGWLDLPLSAGLSVSGNCQGRLKGDQVVFRGGILNVSAGNLSSGSFLTTSIPAAIKPTGSVVIQTVVYATSPYPLVTQFTGGTNHYQLVAGTFVQGDTIFLHDKTYMLA